MLLEVVARVANAVSSLAMLVTSSEESWKSKASKGKQKRGEDAVPKISPGSNSRYPDSGIVYRPVKRWKEIDHIVAVEGSEAVNTN